MTLENRRMLWVNIPYCDRHRLCLLQLAVLVAGQMGRPEYDAYLLCLETGKYPIRSAVDGFDCCWGIQWSGCSYILSKPLFDHLHRGVLLHPAATFKYYQTLDEAVLDYREAHRKVHQS